MAWPKSPSSRQVPTGVSPWDTALLPSRPCANSSSPAPTLGLDLRHGRHDCCAFSTWQKGLWGTTTPPCGKSHPKGQREPGHHRPFAAFLPLSPGALPCGSPWGVRAKEVLQGENKELLETLGSFLSTFSHVPASGFIYGQGLKQGHVSE